MATYKCSGCGAEYDEPGECTGNPALESGHPAIELEKIGGDEPAKKPPAKKKKK